MKQPKMSGPQGGQVFSMTSGAEQRGMGLNHLAPTPALICTLSSSP